MAQFDPKKYAEVSKGGDSLTKKTTKRSKTNPRKTSLKRRRRRKKSLLLKKTLHWRNPKRKILLQQCPKDLGIWTISSVSTPTMTKTSLSPISGRSLIRRTFLSGGVTTSTTTN